MKIQKGDKVKIISGKSKGIESVVLKTHPKDNTVTVEKINIVSRHVKKGRMNQGGIVKMEKPINVSNVKIICPKCKKDARVGYKIIDGKKYRMCKKCSEVIKN